MARKALSKKTRFEVFKRDGFCCQYCGSHPPKVVLEVDHICPVSKGGDNSEGNLITSCFDCNRGKSDIPLSSVPDSIKDKTERIKEAEKQLKEYKKHLDSLKSIGDQYVWDIVHELFGDEKNEIRTDWFKSIRRFNEVIGYEESYSSAMTASYRFLDKRYKDEDLFKYFCGICWNKSKEFD